MPQRLGDGIWTAQSADGVDVMGFHYPTRMVVIRLSGGDLFVWSPTPLTDDLRAWVDALGRVRHVVAPNSLHHLHLADWLEAYPDAVTHAPPGLRSKRRDLRFDHDLSNVPHEGWTGQVDQVVMRGNLITTEVVFFHVVSRTVLFADLIQDLPSGSLSGWRSVVARLDLMVAPEPTVPRKFRVAFIDRRAARTALARILEWPVETVVMAHGPPITPVEPDYLRRAFFWLSR